MKEADTPYIRCVNPACPAQQFERIRHYASRNAMDIIGLGDRHVSQLIATGLIKDAAGLYDLTAPQLADFIAHWRAANPPGA